MIHNQLGDLLTHSTRYTSPALTQKVFANMRRVGKGCLGVETPLFEGILVAEDLDEQGADIVVSRDDVHDQSIPSPTPPTLPPQPPQDLPSTTQEALDACAALTRRVEHLEHDKVAQALEITKLKKRVKKLERDNKGRMIADLDRDTGVALMDDEGTEKKAKNAQEDEPEVQEAVDVVTTAKLITKVVVAKKKMSGYHGSKRGIICKMPAETKSKDKRKGKMVEEPKPIKKKQQVEMDEEYARKLHEKLNQDIDWSLAIDHVKQKAKEDPYVQRYQVMKKRPQTEAQAQRNMIMYLKNTAGFKLDYFKGMSYDDIPQKAAKRRKMNEDVEDLKQHLEIVHDEDDGVYTEATPLARKVPVMDYHIIHLNNKPRYKIIRADGTHQLYVSFITLLKNFDREDLESLWSIVKERFSTSKPNNVFNDYLLTTLRAMFGRPDG
nr:hypothetical protein [Tanacetum cinerariifolium]